MKKNSRIIPILLAAALSLSLAGCGGKEDEKSANGVEQKEYVWVPEFVQVDDEEFGYSDVQVYDGVMYAVKRDWNEETGESVCSVKGLSLTDGSEKAAIPIAMEKAEEGDENAGSRNLDRFAIDSAGNVWTTEEIYHWDENDPRAGTREFFLCKYDSTGAKISDVDFTKEMGEDGYLSSMSLDSEDRVYLAGDSAIWLFDAEGVYKGKISAGSEAYIASVGMDRDGVMCAVVNEYGGAGGSTTLREIDFEGKAFGNSYADYPGGYSNGQLVPGVEKAVLTHDGSRVYEYDKASQNSEELFAWLDSDINGSNVNYMGPLEDGRIAVITTDWESRETEIALLTKKKSSEVAQKKVIIVGCLYEGSALQTEAVKFNKSNDTYRISIRSYYDYRQVTSDNYQQVMNDALNRLNNDITSNNCPDMLDLAQLNMAQLAAKGALEDLNPYLEKSSVLNREDYIESILESYSYDGALLAIPRSFALMTVVGKTSQVGSEPGWTLEDMLNYANEHPDAAIFDNSAKADILTFLLSYNQGAFVDWETGECKFDTDSFKNLLQFANRFPDEYDWQSDTDDRSTPTKIAQGDVLLDRVYLYSFDSIQAAAGKFNEPVTFIGYPNDEGTSGCYLQADGLIAITAKSENKDGAWAFLEQYLSAESEMYGYDLSARKSALQAAREEATKIEYILDENGEKMLDENGEPMTYGAGMSMSYEDGWSYEYHVTTEEEADTLMHLIEIARPVTDSDSQIMSIITEEAESFFKGGKSVDDVAGVIQSRVKVYVNENR